MSLLTVEGLTVSFPTSDGVVQAVRGLSFDIERGHTLGVVGESGSGKSVSALTMLGLDPGADVTGSAIFEDEELLTMKPRDLQHLRGAAIAMIFQDPLSSLHPHFRVGWQISEMIRAHTSASKEEALAQSIELLRLVNIPEPERRVRAYPHELSGGMRQRVMIAMALSCDPELLVEMQSTLGMAMMVITHDLGVISTIADRVMVMYAGRATERADTRSIFREPHHPYTRGLLLSVPGSTAVHGRLLPIVGQPPSPIRPPAGCAFHPRCPFAMDRCMIEQPPLASVGKAPGHTSACFLPREMVGADASTDAARRGYSESRRGDAAQGLAGVQAARQGAAARV